MSEAIPIEVHHGRRFMDVLARLPGVRVEDVRIALTRDQLVLDLQALVSERRMSVLFITHSISEAVFLSDRVVVMTPRPGRIDRIIDIKLPRPRKLAMRETPEFAEYSREILDLFLARGVLREH